MGIRKLLFALILVLMFITTGCSSGMENEEQTIIVQKLVGDKDEYNHFREVTDIEQVGKVTNILDKTNWTNAEVSMVHPADYKFHFEYIDKKIQSDSVIYALWISPNKDKIELVMQGAGKYVQLNKSKSAELFEIVTGEKLSDLK